MATPKLSIVNAVCSALSETSAIAWKSATMSTFTENAAVRDSIVAAMPDAGKRAGYAALALALAGAPDIREQQLAQYCAGTWFKGSVMDIIVYTVRKQLTPTGENLPTVIAELRRNSDGAALDTLATDVRALFVGQDNATIVAKITNFGHENAEIRVELAQVRAELDAAKSELAKRKH